MDPLDERFARAPRALWFSLCNWNRGNVATVLSSLAPLVLGAQSLHGLAEEVTWVSSVSTQENSSILGCPSTLGHTSSFPPIYKNKTKNKNPHRKFFCYYCFVEGSGVLIYTGAAMAVPQMWSLSTPTAWQNVCWSLWEQDRAPNNIVTAWVKPLRNWWA